MSRAYVQRCSFRITMVPTPTASGKTDLAIALAAELNCELVSVDSALVYRGLDIGTAKVDAETLERVPHHCLDFWPHGRDSDDRRCLAGHER